MTYTRPDQFAGHKTTADEWDTILDQVDSLTAPGWTNYSSLISWTSSGTTPSLGNGTLTAYYRRSNSGDVLEYRGILTWGSTTNGGTGIWRFSLPVNAGANEVGLCIGSAFILDNGTQRWAAACYAQAATYLHVVSGSGGDVTATVPQTWANTDVLSWRAFYEPA